MRHLQREELLSFSFIPFQCSFLLPMPFFSPFTSYFCTFFKPFVACLANMHLWIFTNSHANRCLDEEGQDRREPKILECNTNVAWGTASKWRCLITTVFGCHKHALEKVVFYVRLFFCTAIDRDVVWVATLLPEKKKKTAIRGRGSTVQVLR